MTSDLGANAPRAGTDDPRKRVGGPPLQTSDSPVPTEIPSLFIGRDQLALGIDGPFPEDPAFAGARSVLASLWSVSDDSTADLMKRFYGYLRDGRNKDEALRAAQVVHGQHFDHPYYWAAFQLTGDWK